MTEARAHLEIQQNPQNVGQRRRQAELQSRGRGKQPEGARSCCLSLESVAELLWALAGGRIRSEKSHANCSQFIPGTHTRVNSVVVCPPGLRSQSRCQAGSQARREWCCRACLRSGTALRAGNLWVWLSLAKGISLHLMVKHPLLSWVGSVLWPSS